MTTITSLVFQLCDKYGDQTSIEFLMKKLNPMMARAQDRIAKEQSKLIEKTGLTPETFFESEEFLIKSRQKMVLVKVMKLGGLWGRLVQSDLSYKSVIQARREWRKANKINRDCRTYTGQPDRNMVKK